VCPGSVMVEQEESGPHDLVVKDGDSYDDDGFIKWLVRLTIRSKVSPPHCLHLSSICSLEEMISTSSMLPH